MTNYRSKSHFIAIAPEGATLNRVSANACEYETDKERGMIYESTIVARKELDTMDIFLNSGWWESMTTKKWMNVFLARETYWIKVFQKQFIRYVDTSNWIVEFERNMKL